MLEQTPVARQEAEDEPMLVGSTRPNEEAACAFILTIDEL